MLEYLISNAPSKSNEKMFTSIGDVLHVITAMGKTCESGAVEVDSEGREGGAKGVDTHIKLLAA